MHWDHVGDPRAFPSSIFVVGHGSFALLAGTCAQYRGGHSFFEPDLLPRGRSVELSDPWHEPPGCAGPDTGERGKPDFAAPWLPHPVFALPHTLDVFGDGSVRVVDAPGHLPGHVNLLVRMSDGQHVYLGGDACHDRRLLTGEKQIGEWTDAEGQVCCIHVDREAAEGTIRRIRELEGRGVEVVFAHDVEWEADLRNRGRFFGVD